MAGILGLSLAAGTLVEVMPVSEELRRLTVEHRSSDDIKRQAIADGMVGLFVFEPDGTRMPMATTFTVRVPAGTRAASGATLAEGARVIRPVIGGSGKYAGAVGQAISTNLGSKGLGEPPIVPTAAAIANAVYDAIGVRITALPITPDARPRQPAPVGCLH